MPTQTDSLDVDETALSEPGDAPSGYFAGGEAYGAEMQKAFQRPIPDSGEGSSSRTRDIWQAPVEYREAVSTSSVAADGDTDEFASASMASGTFEVVESALTQPGDAPSSYLIFGDALAAELQADATSLRSIHAGASYFSRIDEISPVDFTVTIEGALDMIFGQTVTAISGGQTLYLGLFEDSTETEVSLPVPAGEVQMLVVRSSAAPGTGESATFTVRRNGSDQAMTTSISGSSLTANTSSNSVTCSTGDRIAVKLVTSSSAAAAHYRFTLKYQLST